MTNPNTSMRPIRRPIQAQPAPRQGIGFFNGRFARRINNPDHVTNAVRSLGTLFDRATQPAQDLGSWAIAPIRERLANPFVGRAPHRATHMPGTRGRTINRP